MAVYVDQLRKANRKWCNGEFRYCHMFADTEDELHLLAYKIGLKRSWFQTKRYPHYDLTPSKRKLAIMNGAVEMSTKAIIGDIHEKEDLVVL